MQRIAKRGLSLLAATACSLAFIPSASAVTEDVENAILYPSSAGTLEYNVVHSAATTASTKVIDSTGTNIGTVEALETLMGTPESPSTSFMDFSTTLGKAVHADLSINDQGTEDEQDDVVDTITIRSIADRPIVGISWKKDTIGSDYQGFSEAYERNGANAVFISQVTNDQEAHDVLGKLDGIFMTGGEDWNPSLYGETTFPHGSVGWNDARDTSDIALMQTAIAMDVPLFAVCRGEQGLNVALGGGLIQDIPTYLGQQVKDGTLSENDVTVIPNKDADDSSYRVWLKDYTHSGGTGYHNLPADAVSKDSKWMADIVGDEGIDLVATAHHQAVNPEKLGKGLTIVARTPDGIVEGIEYQANLFALAIQFHPERDALKDTRMADTDGDGVKDTVIDVDQDKCNEFLRALVDHASIYAEQQSSSNEKPSEPEVTPNPDPSTSTPSEETSPSEETTVDANATNGSEDSSVNNSQKDQNNSDVQTAQDELASTGSEISLALIAMAIFAVLGITARTIKQH